MNGEHIVSLIANVTIYTPPSRDPLSRNIKRDRTNIQTTGIPLNIFLKYLPVEIVSFCLSIRIIISKKSNIENCYYYYKIRKIARRLWVAPKIQAVHIAFKIFLKIILQLLFFIVIFSKILSFWRFYWISSIFIYLFNFLEFSRAF